MSHISCSPFVFFFNDTATTEIYTLSLHDALPISSVLRIVADRHWATDVIFADTLTLFQRLEQRSDERDRKSTRLNSSHQIISYAVFCLKKKKTSSAARMSRRGGAPSPPASNRRCA